MNEWLYRNSMNEYEQRLNAADKERKALKLTTPLSINKIVAGMVSSVRLPQTNRARLQRNR
jgi:hypothetical protein